MHDFGNRLLEILSQLPALEDYDSRSVLLRNLPREPVGGIRRNPARTPDLYNIVEAAEGWGKLESGEWALVVIAKTALFLAKGTQLGRQLEALLADSGIYGESQRAIPFQALREAPYFVARDDELHTLQAQIRQTEGNLVIGLSGLAGVGKTTLAVHLAHALRDHFKDGVLWGQLDTSPPEDILLKFGQVFGDRAGVSQAPDLDSKSARMRQILANKQVLVILDNAEKLDEVEWLIPDGAQNVTVITSRDQELLAYLGAAPSSLSPFSEAEGVSLLGEMIGPNRITAEPVVAEEIVTLVEGLPLALNIVGGYLAGNKQMGLPRYKALLANEQKRLHRLRRLGREHRSVAASFGLSYQALNSVTKRVFASLSFFNGSSFGVEAVAAATEIDADDIEVEYLARLQALSLITSVSDEADPSDQTTGLTQTRYHLHTLLKLFAREKLGADFGQEVDAIYDRATHYFADFTAQHGDPDNYHYLDLEWENIIYTLRWAYEQQKWAQVIKTVQNLTQLKLGVVGFVDTRGYWPKAQEMLGWALKGAEALADPFLKATILAKSSAFALGIQDPAAEAQLQECLTILDDEDDNLPPFEDVSLLKSYIYILIADLKTESGSQQDGDGVDYKIIQDRLTKSLAVLGDLETEQANQQRGKIYILQAGILGDLGDLEGAIEKALEGLAYLPHTPNSIRVDGLTLLSNYYSWLGDGEKSLAYLRQGIEMARTLNDVPQLATLWALLGTDEAMHGHYIEAIDHYSQALVLYRQIGKLSHECQINSSLGLAYHRLGEKEKAFACLKGAIDLAEKHQFLEAEATAKINWSRLQIDYHDFDQARLAADRAYALCSQLSLVFELPEALNLRAEIAIVSRDFQAALTWAEEAIQAAEDCEYLLAQGVSWRVKANVLSKRGAVDPAEAAYQRSETLLLAQDQYELAKTQLDWAHHYAHNQQIQLARTKAPAALALFEQLQAKRDIAAAQALLDQLDASSGYSRQQPEL